MTKRIISGSNIASDPQILYEGSGQLSGQELRNNCNTCLNQSYCVITLDIHIWTSNTGPLRRAINSCVSFRSYGDKQRSSFSFWVTTQQVFLIILSSTIFHASTHYFSPFTVSFLNSLSVRKTEMSVFVARPARGLLQLGVTLPW